MTAVNVYYHIQNILEGHLQAMPGLPKVLWTNADVVEPELGDYWLRPWVMEGATTSDLGGTSRHTTIPGLFQIDVFGPKGQGTAGTKLLAGQIIGHYNPPTVYTEGDVSVSVYRIDQQSVATPGTFPENAIEPNFYQLILNVFWRCQTPDL